MRAKAFSVLAGLTGLLVSAGAWAEPSQTVVFAGANAAEDSWYTYTGAVRAVNGDLSKAGWLLRVAAGGGDYEYETSLVPSGEVEGTVLNADAAIGYQFMLGQAHVSAYLGPSFENHSLEAPGDASNTNVGSSVGGRVQGELSMPVTDMLGTGLIATYSSNNDSYWARARVSAGLMGISVGSEVIGMGSSEYDEQRYGVFVRLNLLGIGIEPAVGYTTNGGRSGGFETEGLYGGLGVTLFY